MSSQQRVRQRPDAKAHHSFQYFSENDVLAVQPAGHHGGDEELRAVGVFAGVGHAEPAGAVVLQLEVLVGEAVAVNALALAEDKARGRLARRHDGRRRRRER